MAEQFPSIGDIRGRGAMIAIELVRPGSLEPDAELASALSKYCHTHGVVTLTTGTYGNVFRFLPSLAMPLPLLEEALTVLEQAFEAVTA
jgi:4-aminobutyrate aminotransferase / (S)-3-amino-2-methylpropionate transaminase / 5-aminovalerate transaminase